MINSRKKIHHGDIGEVRIHRKKRMKSIRLRVEPGGTVVLSLPRWVMLKQALTFLENKKDWVIREKSKKTLVLKDGDTFGNGMLLSIQLSDRDRPSSSFDDNCLLVNLPGHFSSERAQEFIKKKINETLRNEAERSLLPRLRGLADSSGIKYSSATVNILKSRWGSCDHKANIKLNVYLIQLPNGLIDYVLAHELAHIKHMNHSKEFWQEVSAIYPDQKTAKRQLRQYNPQIKI